MQVEGNSVTTGTVTKISANALTSYLIPGIIGPIICIILFHVYGNNWTFEEMKPVFLTGLACELPCAFLACFYSDKDIVPEDEQTNEEEKNENENASTKGS